MNALKEAIKMSKRMQKWGIGIFGIGLAGLLTFGSIDMYTVFTADTAPRERYDRVTEMRNELSDCYTNENDCAVLRDKYDKLMTKRETSELLASHSGMQHRRNLLGLGVGSSFLILIAGMGLNASEKDKELREWLADREAYTAGYKRGADFFKAEKALEEKTKA